MDHTKSLCIVIAVVAAWTAGCAKRETQMTPEVKIKVLADGSILLDDKKSTIAEVDARLGDTEKVKGVVWYYREAGTAEPPPAAMQVIELVMKHRLPVSMSSKPDFSDVVDDRGVSRPRR